MPEATDNINHAICCFPICVFIHLNDKCTMAYLWPSKCQHYYALWGHYYVKVWIKCEHCAVWPDSWYGYQWLTGGSCGLIADVVTEWLLGGSSGRIVDVVTSGYWEGPVCNVAALAKGWFPSWVVQGSTGSFAALKGAQQKDSCFISLEHLSSLSPSAFLFLTLSCPGWPWIHGPPPLTSQVLELQVYTTREALPHIFYIILLNCGWPQRTENLHKRWDFWLSVWCPSIHPIYSMLTCTLLFSGNSFLCSNGMLSAASEVSCNPIK